MLLKYNCESKIIDLCVEWCTSSSITVPLAFMTINNFKANDDTQYYWQWQNEHIVNMKAAVRNDLVQLRAFTNHASKIED